MKNKNLKQKDIVDILDDSKRVFTKIQLHIKYFKHRNVLIVIFLFLPFLSNAQETKQNTDSCKLTCQRYFYYLDVVRDYLSGYPVSKDFFNLALSAIEETSFIKSKIIQEDYTLKYYESDYKQDMQNWILWYVNKYCKLRNRELKRLYKRYFPINMQEHRCPCEN